MAQDKPRMDDNAGKHTQLPEAERQQRLMQLVLCSTKLSASDALLLREVFPEIIAAKHDEVWSWLRRRGLLSHEAEDLLQEVFLALHSHILEHGFPIDLKVMLQALTERRLMNHLRLKRRALDFGVLPSSGAEKLRSGPDAERTQAIGELARRLLDQLSPALQRVVDLVLLNGLSNRDAATVLELREGTVKPRMLAAKRELSALAERLLPPSQRNTS